MVRQISSLHFHSPWPFVKKGALGQRKIGPMTNERLIWPGQNKEFPELSPNLVPRFNRGLPPQMNGYHGVQPEGYTHPTTGRFVDVPEMTAELVVPDLTGFKLRPYVSYRTDVEIRKKEKKFDELVAKKGVEKASESLSEADHWPPPATDARLLFDLFYAEQVRKAYVQREKTADDGGGATSLFSGSKMRLPSLNAKRSFHTTATVAHKYGRGPIKIAGWYPRDHMPGPYPRNDEERRAAAMRYGLRPEDYQPIDPDSVRKYAGDYPEIGNITYAHRDPYEDYSYRLWRRNWNEPVTKEWIRFRPDRYTFTGLDTQAYTWRNALKYFVMIVGAVVSYGYYIRNNNFTSFTFKNPVMPKQYAYDYHRAWPLNDPQLYPVVNYSFEPAHPPTPKDETEEHH